MHIDHINIAAPMELLEEVREFYCAVLDLNGGFRPKFSQRGFWLFFKDPAGTGLEVNFLNEP